MGKKNNQQTQFQYEDINLFEIKVFYTSGHNNQNGSESECFHETSSQADVINITVKEAKSYSLILF